MRFPCREFLGQEQGSQCQLWQWQQW